MNGSEKFFSKAFFYLSILPFLRIPFETCWIWGACERCLVCIWKSEFGAWPRYLELEVIHGKVVTAMDAIQEITTLPSTYPNTLQLCILRPEDGFMLRNNSHIQSQTQPCSHVAKPSRSRHFLRLVPAEPHSNTGARNQFGPRGGWPYISVCPEQF